MMTTILLTTLAMLAFAANSILCRLALADGAIDAASFTSIRLFSGALTLLILLMQRTRKIGKPKLNIPSSLMLFIYAIGFSFAYLQLSAGTGALLLFCSVQLTMISYGLLKGERPHTLAVTGIVMAFGGLVYLLSPGITAPPLASSRLMITAGIAWGGYTLRGKGSTQPLVVSTWNFVGTLPLVLISSVVFHQQVHFNTNGLILAVTSGAAASALGYVIWYSALPRLTAFHAASVQLSVPVIAALAGVVVLAEPMSWRLLIAAVLVLGGIYLTVLPSR